MRSKQRTARTLLDIVAKQVVGPLRTDITYLRKLQTSEPGNQQRYRWARLINALADLLLHMVYI